MKTIAKTQTTTKTATVKTVATSTPSETSTKSSPGVLTVVVVDEKSQLAPGATVIVLQSGATGTTNSAGEVQFKLGNASKYDIQVSLGSKTVTVPYYVTAGGSMRLMVNPSYVHTVETAIAKSKNPANFFSTGLGVVSLVVVILAVLIGAFLMWRRRNVRRSQINETEI